MQRILYAAASIFLSGLAAASHADAEDLLTYSGRSVTLSENLRMTGHSEYTLALPDGGIYRVTMDPVSVSENGLTLQTGQLVGFDETYRVIITSGQGTSFGLITTPTGNWSLAPERGQGDLVLRRSDTVPQDVGQDVRVPPVRVDIVERDMPDTPAVDIGSDGNIDIGIVYTQGLVDYYGPGLMTRIQQMVNTFDQALVDSDTGLRGRLAGATMVPVAWDELTSTDETFDDLVAGASFGNPGTEADVFGTCSGGENACVNNGDLSSLQAWRNGIGADVVVMIRRLHWPEHRYCGLAYVPGFGAEGEIDPATDDILGVAVVSVGPDGNGSPRDCTDMTFVHEVGHNLGIVHNYENSGAEGGDEGVFSYAFAHRIDCAFRTAVGYDSVRSGVTCDTPGSTGPGNEAWLPRFSNALQTDCQDQVCGVAVGGSHMPGSPNDNTTAPADAVRAIREQGRNVQFYRDEAPSTRSAVLPYSRTVGTGEAATAFLSVINPASTNTTAEDCGLRIHGIGDGQFTFQRTDPATNEPIGSPGDLADIPAGGVQSFVFSLTRPTVESFDDIVIDTACSNRTSSPVVFGLNTFRFATSAFSLADIIALAATIDGNGIVTLPATGGAGAFSVATTNLGAFSSLDVSVEAGANAPGFDLLEICRTDPATGQCLTARSASFRQIFAANSTLTFAVFVRSNQEIPNDPANNRVFVHFRTPGGQSVGATSVAVRTAAQ